MQINQPSSRAIGVLLEVALVAEGVFPALDANRECKRNEDEEYGDPQEYPYAADYLPHGRPAVDEPSERHGSHRDEHAPRRDEAGTVDGSLSPVFELAVHEDAAARVIHGLPQREENHQAHDDRFDRRSVERNGDYDDLGS